MGTTENGAQPDELEKKCLQIKSRAITSIREHIQQTLFAALWCLGMQMYTGGTFQQALNMNSSLTQTTMNKCRIFIGNKIHTVWFRIFLNIVLAL